VARELVPHDITGAPDMVELAEEVARTGAARVLTRDGEALAIVSPVPNKRRRRPESRRAKPTSLNDWLGDLIGVGKTSGPGDVSANIHRYVAEAIHVDSGLPTSE
jgi:hypothetical protein